jgi:glycosyltransferase involved in cell wall biosynthesis
MKIALLHPTFWPQAGGVEHLVRDQANMLSREGHEVTVVTGSGRETGEPYRVQVISEMAPTDKQNVAVTADLQSGQVGSSFTKYRDKLIKLLGKALGHADLTLVHNVFTTQGNLALTAALRELSAKHRLIAWTHDVAAADTDQVVPNADHAPWSFMRTPAPNVLYVAASEATGDELAAHLQPPVPVEVIPNTVDVTRAFGLTPEIRASLARTSSSPCR